MNSAPKPFTLLQVIPAFQSGGVEQTTLDIAAALTSLGGRALVASAGGRLEERLKAVGGVHVTMPLDSKNPAQMVLNGRRLARLIRAEGVSLVHVRSRAPAFSAIWAARRTGVPIVTTYHGVYNAGSSLKRWYNSIMTKGDLTIANSDFTRRHVMAEHGVPEDKVVSVPRGVDLRRFNPDVVEDQRLQALRADWGVAPDENRLILLLAGRLTRWKGHLLIMQALARLKAETGQDQVLLIMAGDDQGRRAYVHELQAAITNHALQGSVKLVGHVTDMPAAYLVADAALAPSLEPEAFGRTAVEPQAMGRPVLAADHGAVQETVVDGETGWRVEPGDIGAWTLALKALLALEPEQRAAMGQAGRTRVCGLYALETMAERTLALYQKVLQDHAA